MTAATQAPWIVEAARQRGDHPAIRTTDGQRTWKEVAGEAEALASELARRGLGPGDVLLLRLAPCPRFIALLHAAQMLGATLLPLHPRASETELDALLQLARPRLFLDDAGSGHAGLHPHDDFPERSPAKSFRTPTAIDPHATLTIVATSGTTSEPKLVELSSAAHAASATASRRRLGHGEGDVWLATLPLHHVGGLAILARSVLEGSTVLLESGFSADRLGDVLRGGAATMVSVVPTMLARVLDAGLPVISPRLRCVLTGGAALSPPLGRRALEVGLPLSATYGLTEACSQVCTTEPSSPEAGRGSVGRPLPGLDVSIADADADGWGTVRVRGPVLMRGYLGNEQATASALQGGWLVTGDIGRLGEDGALELAGRRDDVVVSGGENVAPLEVERVLDEHGDVAESLVVGVPDDEWGQRVVACVVAHAGRRPDPRELRDWCRARLSPPKVPREFRVVESLPRGPTGKVLRRAVADGITR